MKKIIVNSIEMGRFIVPPPFVDKNIENDQRIDVVRNSNIQAEAEVVPSSSEVKVKIRLS